MLGMFSFDYRDIISNSFGHSNLDMPVIVPSTVIPRCRPSRSQQVRGGGQLHPDQVRGPEQEEGHQGNLHPLHLRHRHQERAVCVRRRH